MNKQTKLVLKVIKTEMLAELKRLEIDRVVVEYSGSGDSGQTDAINIYSKAEKKRGVEIDGSKTMVSLTKVKRSYDAKFDTVLALTKDRETRSLDNTLEDFCETMVEAAGHGGWENNEGGNGVLTIDVAKGTVTLKHNTCVESYETDEASL